MLDSYTAVRCCCNANLRGFVPVSSEVPLELRECEDGTSAYDSDGKSDHELLQIDGFLAVPEGTEMGKKTWKKTWRK
jgi:hypothetical protein